MEDGDVEPSVVVEVEEGVEDLEVVLREVVKVVVVGGEVERKVVLVSVKSVFGDESLSSI